ncbi:ca2+-modulated nonselective cation channel polycystin [Pyrenophora seminiperda CCB06]|uniref:Ca2+-modulated nonselective cation channel polycystin n=1 Tax=Pyrenophora seminiperda CCB06 TaxID=1302712 RepID=A0A3M7M9I2_9PLEO|nr:ca2+-modulated nonselective cation channel polycystin [Pyrenophora seminiperda CCB06]
MSVNELVPAIPSSTTTQHVYNPNTPLDPQAPSPSLDSFVAKPTEPPKLPQFPASSHHVGDELASPSYAHSLPTPTITSPSKWPSFLTFYLPQESPQVPPPFLNSTSVSINATVTDPGDCTGCVIAAYSPVTTSFNSRDYNNRWTNVVVTATVITEYATYMNNNTIETVLTERRTVNQTKILTMSDGQIISHQTPTFVVSVTDGVHVTLDAGPTYVIYNNVLGALDHYSERYWPKYEWTEKGCNPTATSLLKWQPPKNATKDWTSFIGTYTEGDLPKSTAATQAFALPSKAIEYLKQQPVIISQYHGSDIATCSVSKPAPSKSFDAQPTPEMPQLPGQISNIDTGDQSTTIPIYETPYTSTFLSTTYDTTSVHVTVRGCLRCQDTSVNGLDVPPNKVDISTPTPPGLLHYSGNKPTPVKPDQPAEITKQPTPGDARPVPAIPDGAHQTPQVTTTSSVTIGGVVFPIYVPRPTWHDDTDQNSPPIIVIGQETFTPGQTKTVNGVPVVAPPDNSGAVIVVGGNTIPLNPAVTPSPLVITIGGGTVAANPQGEFVFGPVTLKSGGPPIVVNGNTISLGSNGIAIVNGVTQTISNAPVPTPIPALTVGGQNVPATVVGGSPVFVIAPGKTVSAGSTIIVDGTTYGVPTNVQGPTIVINGKTSILSAGQSAITQANGLAITAQVNSGVTAYVLAPGQTLTPGGIIAVSGTTYSLPADGLGSVVVISGVTSTIPNGTGITTASALTINGVTYTYNVRDGTTEYILAKGTTLALGGTVVVDGTTYSLDKSGTALVINGQTSALTNLPKSTSATTTSSGSSSATTSRNAGDLIASGIGESSKHRGGAGCGTGIDKWVESLFIGVAGWLILLL